MSVLEYAEDVGRSVEQILTKCRELKLNVSNEDDELNEEAITELDYFFTGDNAEDLDEATEDIEDELEDQLIEKENKKINDLTRDNHKKQTINKVQNNKKELAKKKKEMYKSKEKLTSNVPVENKNVIIYKDNLTIGNLAKELGVTPAELIKKLFSLGVLATVNNVIDFDNASLLVMEYGKEIQREQEINEANFEDFEIVDDETSLIKRPPVVTIMGHVDHGKTTLLDTIRKTNVALGEAGGITQAISAYQVTCNGELITFIDTPGHAAFTEMRARGASITDIVIIIVAADDGVMPQTKEAIDHAKAANVPIIVAINKIDKPDANPDRVMTELAEYGLTPDEWGGDNIFVKISAKTGEGIDKLLENILLVAEMEEYKANPNRYASGSVVESRLDKQVGPIVTMLIQNGTLRLGDPIVVGNAFGKVRTMKNDLGEEIIEAKPSTPVEITGLNETPSAGDKFMAFETEKQARQIGETRKDEARLKQNAKSSLSLEDIFAKIQDGVKEINVIIKADVNGSAEAVKNSFEKIDVEGVKVKVIRSSVGAITESDIVLAQASNAIMVGFNVRPNNAIKEYAKECGVEIRLYDIIYKAVEEMEAAMKGMLDPEYEEKITGDAEVRQLFKFSKVGTIAGSYVNDGVIKNNSKARVIRDGVTVYDGQIGSVQREKEAVKEVKKGLECGITISNFNDLRVNDIIETYEMVEIKR
ncbi:MAG: translation initiation factor IF-2 [Bacilli bacterium]|nr:translation initiation factor IF-2 [Bacilli bacterium]